MLNLKMFSDTPRVLSIQSHAVHGYVGNKSAIFPMQILGFEVDSINTVQIATHGGYSHTFKGSILDGKEIAELVEGLRLNEVDNYTHLVTGFFNSVDALQQVADIVRKLRQKNPDIIYVCDPLMGDNGIFYVPEDIIPIYRDILVPLADIITPNQFEAELITGLPIKSLDEALTAIKVLHGKGVKTVVLSSLALDDKNIISIASSKGSCYSILIPKIDAIFIGTGDLFTALFLSWSYKTNNDLKITLEKTIATMQSIVKDTYQKARVKQPTGKLLPPMMELRMIQNKAAIEAPVAEITATQINVHSLS